MPNWCETTVIITGNEEDLRRLSNAIGDNFDFDRLIPMPEELRETTADWHQEHRVYYEDGSDDAERERRRAELDQDPKNRARADLDQALLEKYGAYDWYEWRCTNWGTKWPPDSVWIEAHSDSVVIDFDTAWSFPGPVFQRLSEMFPSLNFRGRAVEHGMAWALDFEAHNGKLSIDDLDYEQEYPYLVEGQEDEIAVS